MVKSRRLDSLPISESALYLKFLSTAAGVFADFDLFHVGDLSELRNKTFSGKPGQSSNLIEFLINRYGEADLSYNLLRLGLKPEIIKTRLILSKIGELLIAKAKLLFNRPFLLFNDYSIDRRTFYSTVLVETAQNMALASEQLDSWSQHSLRFTGNSLASADVIDKQADEALAQAFGLPGIRERLLSRAEDRHSMNLLSNHYLYLCDSLNELIEQYRRNDLHSRFSDLRFDISGLAENIQFLQIFRIPLGTNMEDWDYFRQRVLENIHNINERLEDLTSDLAIAFGIPSSTLPDLSQYPTANRRYLVSILMARGLSAIIANNVTTALIQYCEMHRVSADKVFPGELTKLHPTLDQKCLDALIVNELSEASKLEKTQTHLESERLQTLFSEWRASLQSLVLLTLIFLPLACGVKTAPKSDLEDFRPRISFKSPASPSPAPFPAEAKP